MATDDKLDFGKAVLIFHFAENLPPTRKALSRALKRLTCSELTPAEAATIEAFLAHAQADNYTNTITAAIQVFLNKR
jgi:hypothetical protein